MKNKNRFFILFSLAAVLLAFPWAWAAPESEEMGGSRFNVQQALNPTGFACGNGLLEIDEQCDDGNQVNEDACSNACEANQVLAEVEINKLINEGALKGAARETGLQKAPFILHFGVWTKSALLIILIVGFLYYLDWHYLPRFMRKRMKRK